MEALDTLNVVFVLRPLPPDDLDSASVDVVVVIAGSMSNASASAGISPNPSHCLSVDTTSASMEVALPA